ncbi:ATP-binding cassette domain-containing protein [Candidatus Bipolaricaulota bacterium]|nr:ATP-binding cassette domain-containing protein [Candidatus Bipolaricaulota bacterium]MCF7890254.1 ATP-binding cassette domain-containing protein [Candidatus Bipolaricaulota bacterium]
MLELRDFEVRYGNFKAIKNLSFSLARGEALGLTGRNGVGKTSTLKGIIGLVETRGKVIFRGDDLSSLEPHDRAARGIGYLPQEKRIFNQLTVEENLRLVTERGGVARVKDEVLDLFPVLKGRFNQKAGDLSGGEQAMVAIARLLIPSPELLLLDEPTEGLMPEVEKRLHRVLEDNLSRNRSALIAGQNANFLRVLSSKVYQLSEGRVDRVIEE